MNTFGVVSEIVKRFLPSFLADLYKCCKIRLIEAYSLKSASNQPMCCYVRMKNRVGKVDIQGRRKLDYNLRFRIICRRSGLETGDYGLETVKK